MATLQVRNVPEDVHEALRERARREGITLSELISRELPRIAREASLQEIDEWIRSRPTIPGPSAADLVREAREERDQELLARIDTRR